MHKSKTSFIYLLLSAVLFYQCSLMSKEKKETSEEQKKTYNEKLSLQMSYSVGVLKSVAQYTKEVAVELKASQSNIITARAQSGSGGRNIITGRIMTGRAPILSAKSINGLSPRLKPKQEEFGCEEETTQDGKYINFYSGGATGFLLLQNNVGSISISEQFASVSALFLNCGQTPSFSCQDYQDFESFLNEITQFILENCVIHNVSFNNGIVSCSLNNTDLDGDFDETYISFTTCSSDETCSYKNYLCDMNLSLEDCAGLMEPDVNISELENYVQNNCSIVYEPTDFCIAGDWGISINLPAQSIYVYELQFEEGVSTIGVDICDDINSCSSYFSNSCQIPFSCDFASQITQSPQSILNYCKFEQSGWSKSEDGSWISCQNYDFTGDGIKDKVFFSGSETYYVSIFVDGGQKTSEKTECFSDRCDFYSANCDALGENCQVQNCQWEPVGYSDAENFCLTEDINGDGKKETIYGSSSTVNQFDVVIVRGEGNALKANCTLSTDFELDKCSLEVGSCQTQNICQSISEIGSNCSFNDSGTCTGEDECEKYVLSFLEEEEGDSYCKKVVDRKTGKFVQIRKVEEGYEYSEGTTRDYFSAVCPSDSKVDFSSCTIEGCEKAIQSAKLSLSISGFTNETTRQTFTVKVSDQNSAYGELTIIYYKLSGRADVSGTLNFPSGEKMQIKGAINKDGSFSFDITLDTTEGTFTGHFDGSADGSIKGRIITPSEDTYTVEIGADGRGKICDKNNVCQDIS